MSSRLSYRDINVRQKLNAWSVVFLQHSTKQFRQTNTLTWVMEDKTNNVVKLIQVSAILICIYCGYTTLNCFIWTSCYDFSIRSWGHFKTKLPLLFAWFITHFCHHNYLKEISMFNKKWMHRLSYGPHRNSHAKWWACKIYSSTHNGLTYQGSDEWWPLFSGK